MSQPSLFTLTRFDGATVQAVDVPRLERQLDRVRDLMSDGQWRTLEQIQAICGGSQAGISARLRDLRKSKNGSYTVERRRKYEGSGLFEYRVI